MKLLKRSEKKKINEYLERFDVSLPRFGLARTNDRVWVFSPDIVKVDVSKWKVESLGLYFGRFEKDGFRLSTEGAMFVGGKKNVVILDEEQTDMWMRGLDVFGDFPVKEGYVIIKHKGDILGCGKYKNAKVMNFVRKARRIKNGNIVKT